MKKDAKHAKSARTLQTWQLLGISSVCFLIAIFSLSANNLRAIELRNAVLAADKANADVDTALQELRSFTYAHMNTDLSGSGGIYPPIQLKYRYERLVEAEKQRVSKKNEVIYTQAQKQCEAKFSGPSYGQARIACIKEYALKNGVETKEIPDALYKFAFVAPRWSPDVAGWSLLLGALFALLALVRMATRAFIKATST